MIWVTDAMLQLSKAQSGFGNSDRNILNSAFGIAYDATVSSSVHVLERNREHQSIESRIIMNHEL